MCKTGKASLSSPQPSSLGIEGGADRYRMIRETLVKDGLFEEQGVDTWRVALQAFPLSTKEVSFFQHLGNHLLAFYRGLNRLYLESLRGQQPSWVHGYLDQGKPEALLAFARMNRFRGLLPGVIRPDVIPTNEGMVVTELDSVPGGIGLTGSLAQIYAGLGDQLVGGANGMVEGFATMLRGNVSAPLPLVAIVVSDESEPYRSEMQWLVSQLLTQGLQAACVHPKEIKFTEEGLQLPEQFGTQMISIVYRFFELFDLKNIPKSELVMYTTKKGWTVVTPPYKPWLEEKLAFALFHHPMLERYWKDALQEETFEVLKALMPRTWVLDPQPLPPSAIIPDLQIAGQAVSDWRAFRQAKQKERRYVIKRSGFSELAWGSRGVSIGHDLSQPEWTETLESALSDFSTHPSILQEFHKGRQYSVDYFDENQREWQTMEGRARLSPYYFVQGDQAELAGILATVCPKDKKLIHGMRDGVMVPCAVESEE